jgi:dihydroorotate dehydrogenase (fumarate)
MELRPTVAGIRLANPVMNAAGTCKTEEDVEYLACSDTAAIMVGSITVEPREGNAGVVYWSEPRFSLNSRGLPNRGMVCYREMLPRMVDVAHYKNKPLFLSVAGFSPKEYADLATLGFDCGVDLVELNLGCPNVWHGSVQKRIACFDSQLVAEILRCVETAVGADARIALKISPFSDPFALAEVAQVISRSSMVKVVTTANTFPNALSYSSTGPRIEAGNGLAGLAGSVMKPIGLGQVLQLRDLFPDRIQIIGVGGITCGRDIAEYLKSGAAATGVATAYLDHGESVFSIFLGELYRSNIDSPSV